MNYTSQTPDYDKIQYHTSQLLLAFEDAQVNCELCAGILVELADNHCTGTEHWRDANTPGRDPKLYIIHPLNGVCPIHGNPEPGKRIRTYIGTNPAKIEAAQQAIGRYRHYNNAFIELQALHRRIRQAHRDIRGAWYSLDLVPPTAPPTLHTKDADQE